MEHEEKTMSRLDIADRMAEMGKELLGISEILFIMVEGEGSGSYGNVQLFPLYKMLERFSTELEEMSGQF